VPGLAVRNGRVPVRTAGTGARSVTVHLALAADPNLLERSADPDELVI
jgi:hypothetical protein